ncbi:hypothetical protein CHARACLAT_018584 [Characodon lateralis]|uniref:Uncharacterized protein n=1 Tax=Characodon lateralis TaxID=208331 RepID=A0ABU7DS81_9TELE|nr:hypothetical protein [Characodon lateralis]
MAESSIFVHVGINDMTGKIKPAHAMHAARKHIQKAAQKHMRANQRHPSVDVSVLSSEDGRALFFYKDLDTMSQDSRNGELSPVVKGPAAKAALHKGIMSEPVRRAYRVKIHEPPETHRGFFSRMSSTESHNSSGAAPCVKEESFDLDTPLQLSGEIPAPYSQPQTDQKDSENESGQQNCTEQYSVKRFEPEHSELPEEQEPEEESEVFIEPEHPPEPQHDSIPHSQIPQPQAEAKISKLIPPSSPARVRRTLEAPPSTLQSTLIRTKARSHSCPRKQTFSPQTPAVTRKPALHWHMQQEQKYGSQVRRIPNGLCLSGSSSSNSDGSSDSLEFVPRCLPVGSEQREGTLQREMKALFDQRLKEIRCKSPIFFDDHNSE